MPQPTTLPRAPKERNVYVNIFSLRTNNRTRDLIQYQVESPVTHLRHSVFEMNETKVDKLVSTCRTPLPLVSFIFTLKQEYKYLRARITVTANK
jgi:hypothetical protein